MTHITLTADQAALLRNAHSFVEVHDPQGFVLGVFTPSATNLDDLSSAFSAEEIAAAELEAKSLSPAKGRTLAEIFERLEREYPQSNT